MTNSRKSRFNSGQASRIRVYATQLKQAAEELDEWFLHSQAEAQVDGWDRSVLRRLNRSDILEKRDNRKHDQKEWRVRDAAIDYIEEKGYA